MNTENNKIIAEFLGFKIDEETENYLIPILFAKIGDFKEWADTKHINDVGYYLLSENQFCFDFDWNWLMEVVEKIESLGYSINISSSIVYINGDKGRIINPINIGFNINKIQAVYNACVGFIEWYNKSVS